MAVYFPGVDGGDIWDLPNPGFYFAEELFSNSTLNVHACIPKALAKMIGIQSLTIGYTKDIELAEKIARATGANELIIRTCPEGHTLNLNKEEKARWLEHGWRLEGQTAHKTLMANIMEQQVGVEKVKTAKENECHKQRYLEGGRLKADMLFEDNTEENTKHGDAANMFSRRELMTRAWSEGQSEGNSKGTTQKSTDTSEENSYEMEGIQHSDSYEGEADNEESDQRS